MKPKYKMFPYPVEILIYKKNREFSGGEKFVSYYIEFSVEELRKFSNNFVVISLNDKEFYIYPIDVIACGKEIAESRVFISNEVNDFRNIYNVLFNKYVIASYDKYGEIRNDDFIFLTCRYVWKNEINISERFSMGVGFRNVYNNVVRIVNEFIEKNKRLPDNNEVKEMFIEYLSSYDVKEILESII
ncbi:MAG: hypothetical protein QW795_06555 [Candidatus Bathyarchaeia archaeon]